MGRDILVRVAGQHRTHVVHDKLAQNEGYAWWEMSRLPSQVISRIYFQCGGEIIGYAPVRDVDRVDGRIEWDCVDALAFEHPIAHEWAQRQGWCYFDSTDIDHVAAGSIEPLFRPTTHEEFRAETWEPVETWQREPGRPVYTIVRSCHGWYSWRRYDDAGRVVGFTTGRDECIKDVREHLYFQDA